MGCGSSTADPHAVDPVSNDANGSQPNGERNTQTQTHDHKTAPSPTNQQQHKQTPPNASNATAATTTTTTTTTTAAAAAAGGGTAAATAASSQVSPRSNNGKQTNGTAAQQDANGKKSAADAGESLSSPAARNRANVKGAAGLVGTEDKYGIIKVLGEGASCKVVSVKDKANGKRFAMKIMDKGEPYNKILWENEVKILRTLVHPNILEYVESYEDKRTYHLVTVLCTGGELFDRVKNGHFSEKVAARLTKDMLQALSYCHKHNIVHRDLKPENFVFTTRDEDSHMKLIDFGCAKIVADDEVVGDVAGSPYYCAPEVLSESITRTGRIWKAADMWSVGVIVFLLVCGYPPFNGDTQDRIFKRIKRGKYKFPSGGEGGVELSDSVKELIRELLRMDPKERLTADQALNHPWVSGEAAPDTPLPPVVIDALGQFRHKVRLKKAVARVLAHHMTEDDKENLAQVFKQFDINGDGQLGVEEIGKMMRHIGKSEIEAKHVMEQMDEDGDGGVSMDEFATSVAMGQLGKDKSAIKATFDMFDLDKDGYITHKEIEYVCHFLTPEATQQLIREVDANNDGKINFTEWLAALTDGAVKQVTRSREASGRTTPALIGSYKMRKDNMEEKDQTGIFHIPPDTKAADASPAKGPSSRASGHQKQHSS